MKEINLELENGVYGLLAPNGAGKTTLLNMIATLSFPTHGEITWDGIDIVALDEKYRDILGFCHNNLDIIKIIHRNSF